MITIDVRGHQALKDTILVKWQEKTEKLGQKLAQVPLCQAHMPRGQS